MAELVPLSVNHLNEEDLRFFEVGFDFMTFHQDYSFGSFFVEVEHINWPWNWRIYESPSPKELVVPNSKNKGVKQKGFS